MANSIFYFLRILTLILYIFLLILYIFLLSGGFNNSFIYYINDYRYKRKYNQFKNELISSKWYYDIRTYNEKRRCVLSLYANMTYTLSICKKEDNNEEDISVIEEGIYHIVNVEIKSPMCRVDLINSGINQRFDMILYNKKNKDKIDAFRKGVDFYDKDACVVFYKD